MTQLLLNDALAFGALELPVQQEFLGHVFQALQVINAIEVAAALLKLKVLIQREGNARLHEFSRFCTNFC